MHVSESHIRNDGMVRADARPSSPGVIIAFDCPHGPMQFPCDTFTDWQDNVRAIALALEALRKVDRYGVTRRAEQYTGWKQLPGPMPSAAELTIEQAGEVMRRFGGGRWVGGMHPDEKRRIFRAAQMCAHPDRGGSQSDFELVQKAGRVLGLT